MYNPLNKYLSDSRLKQLGSILLCFVIYTWLLNWKAGLLLVIGVGFHEQSHLIAAKQVGMKTRKFYLVPFLGGVAFIAGRYKYYAQQAIVALAGPIGGGLLAAATAGVYWMTGYTFLAVAAYWMAFLNLFNLFPFSFMDGGQVMGTITYSINDTLGMVCLTVSTLLAIFVLWLFNPIISIFIGVYGGAAVAKEIRNWKVKRDGKPWLCDDGYLNRPKKLNPQEMFATVFCWGGSAICLLALMHYLRHIHGVSMNAIFYK